ncbi:MAG TPA: ankyrin repeat domain-containing protein [Acidobacteriota bacterium]|nr:ankyrin repeat domain-containing protein [Acidobacteriota bacterium]
MPGESAPIAETFNKIFASSSLHPAPSSLMIRPSPMTRPRSVTGSRKEESRMRRAFILGVLILCCGLFTVAAGINDDLIAAAKAGNLEQVKALVAKGANIEAGDETGRTALQFAAGGGKLEVVRFLLAKGATAASIDKNGNSALLKAAFGGHLEIVKLLLDKGLDINQPFGISKATALYVAAQQGHAEVVAELLKRGAKTEIRTRFNSTPLFIASEAGHVKVVQLLLANKAAINVQCFEFRTPLITAAANDRADVVKLLIQAGADVNARDDKGHAALYYAFRPEIKETLKAAGGKE